MASQIFKTQVPNSKLFTLLEAVASKTEKKYVFNKKN